MIQRFLVCTLWSGFLLGSTLTVQAAPAPRSQAPSARKAHALKPLPQGKHKAFLSTVEDELKKKPCNGRRRVTLHCRDKLHYVKSNEARHDAFRPYLRGLGGGYIGVGSDQNFTLIAYARSDFAWLMDYDPVVVWVNLIHRALILKSPTRAAYLKHWTSKQRSKTRRFLLKFYKKHPDRKKIAWVFKSWGGSLDYHFRRFRKRRKRWKKMGIVRNENWLATERYYQYIRTMFQNNRIRVMKGDLLLNKTLQGIGKVTHKHNFPIRVFYFSNAEQFWPYIKQFRSNLRSLKMDKQSIIVRTLASRKYKPTIDYIWSYIVQRGTHYQKLLGESKKIRSVWSFARRMKKVSKGVYALGKPKRK